MKIRSFSIRLFIFVLPFILAVPTIHQSIFIEENTPTQRIFHHRIEKLNQHENLTTILVGDSSLGNAINENVFGELIGETTPNLALNGTYGYAGTYNMTRRALNHSPNLKNVIIIQTLDMMQRNVSDEGFIRTVDLTSPSLITGSEWRQIPNLYFNTLFSPTGINAATYGRSHPNPRPIDVENDYIMQLNPLKDSDLQSARGLVSRNIQMEKAGYLNDLAVFCVQHHLNCIYVHGPIWQEIADKSEVFIDDVNQIIDQEGITLVKQMVTLEIDQIGDSTDHVATESKDDITAVYAELLRPYLED
ncbi:MAG: hypothetical protein AAF490_11330 [Chloroflexota bacterium]